MAESYRENANTMIEELNSRTTREKVIYIYSCLHWEPIREWLEIYRALVQFVCFTSKILV